MSDGLNGKLTTKAILAAALGMVVAAVLAGSFGGLFRHTTAQFDLILALIGFAGMAALLITTYRRVPKGTVMGGRDRKIQSAMTAIAIGLLFVTSFLSGTYLLLVPVVAVVLIVVYLIFVLRSKEE